MEQLLILSIALLLHFGFQGEQQAGFSTSGGTIPYESWVLETDRLVGDTLISLDYDPYFKVPKTFKAFPLKNNLLPILESIQKQEGVQLVFRCSDGYKPHMSLQQVLSSEGYLAYQDLDAPDGRLWADSLTNKFPPFYLVWPHADKQDKSFVNPYGLVAIEFKSAEEAFGAAMPKEEALMEGFELFSTTCMRCHSINKVGGNMAPEFNYPKNITEYWAKEDIWAFIKSPTSYRFNSKMPPMTTLDREAFEKIYQYLAGMTNDKID